MSYRAKQGDIIWLTFDPQAGHEQKGRRPAFVASNNTFNNFVKSAAMVCPITNTDKNIPIQVKLTIDMKTSGVVMCDQTKILDLHSRNAEFIEKAPEDITAEVANIIRSFVEIETTQISEAEAALHKEPTQQQKGHVDKENTNNSEEP